MYKNGIKRVLDIICALLAMVVFCWLYGILAILVLVKLGKPVLFRQVRPGKKDEEGHETLFALYKFRTMTDGRDEKGELLPDEERLTRFGAWLRSTSLDELPEAVNILKGDMSLIGPRPQLVRDLVFMTDDQRNRHNVRPGLSGLAQVRGRNALSWENKLKYDLEYVNNLSFLLDVKITLKTIQSVLHREGINEEGKETTTDYGDYLLKAGNVSLEDYNACQNEAKEMLVRMK